MGSATGRSAVMDVLEYSSIKQPIRAETGAAFCRTAQVSDAVSKKREVAATVRAST